MERLSLPKLTTGNGDVLRADDCQHPICQECLATWISSRVQEQLVFNVRCPFIGCTMKLFEQDLARLVGTGALAASISERFAEIRARDYTARVQALSQTLITEPENDEDFDVLQRLWQTTRLCPRCSLVIERSEGCNSFYCICGHHFDYSTAPRVFGNGMKNYGKLIDVAKSLRLSLSDAEKYGGDDILGKNWTQKRALETHRIVSRISREARLTLDEAWELHQQAKSGDLIARSQIRAARGRAESTNKSEEDEVEEETLGFLWNMSLDRSTSHDMCHAVDMASGSPVDQAIEDIEADSPAGIVQDEEAVVSQICEVVQRENGMDIHANKKKIGGNLLIQSSKDNIGNSTLD
jgi:hypothetical protein